MGAEVLVEFVFEHFLEILTAVITTAGKCVCRGRTSKYIVQVARGRVLVSQQQVIAGAEFHFGHRIQGPGGAEADEVGGLANASFLHIAVNVVHLTPTRPAAP